MYATEVSLEEYFTYTTEESEKMELVPLRLSATLYNAIAAWAEDDFRSVNGQIEYLLTECVRQRKKNRSEERRVGKECR